MMQTTNPRELPVSTSPVDQVLASHVEGIAPDALRELFRDQPAGVAVVTANSENGPVAMTASSLFSVSVAPPLLVFSASAMSSSTPALLAAETLVIHLIDTSSHDVAVLGATPGADRFADPSTWAYLPTGEPYFLSPGRRIRGRVVKTMDAGAATLVVVHAIESWIDADSAGQPLVYHNRTWHALDERSRIA